MIAPWYGLFQLGFTTIPRGVWVAGAAAAAFVLTGGYAWTMRQEALRQSAERVRERRMRDEADAYAALAKSLSPEETGSAGTDLTKKTLAMRVCRTVAEKSAFRSVLMLLRNAQGQLGCAGSIGVDDLTVAAIERWSAQTAEEGRAPRGKSVSISLGEWQNFDHEIASWALSGKKERRRWRRAIVVPIRISGGMDEQGFSSGEEQFAGAIVVCPDCRQASAGAGATHTEQMLGPLEMLSGLLGAGMQGKRTDWHATGLRGPVYGDTTAPPPEGVKHRGTRRELRKRRRMAARNG